MSSNLTASARPPALAHPEGIVLSAVEEIRKYRAAVRPLVLDTGVEQYPIGLCGACFMAVSHGQLFLVTARHLVEGLHNGQVRCLPTDKSMRRLPLSRGVGTITDDVADDVDAIVYPASVVGLSKKTVRAASVLNLDAPGFKTWKPSAHASTFVVVGYPRQHSEIDYEKQLANAGQIAIPATYDSPRSGSSVLHRLRAQNDLHLNDFGGFSGGAVFSVEQQIAAPPITRFCGMAVEGTAESGLLSLIDCSALVNLMHSAQAHIQDFGLELALPLSRKNPTKALVKKVRAMKR
ncbi:MAG TPA: hypothetical protein VK968_01410 [Roseimicrobium sp.]|nr:hypothetical protein [Roseimicrobium sp.]